MVRPQATNPFEQLILDNVRKNGWHCTSVSGDGPTFTYTVGLLDSFDHPELLIIGLSPQLSYSILSKMARAAELHSPFDLNSTTDELLQDHECLFTRVPNNCYGDYVLSANWYYGNTSYPLYQVIWPSLTGHFPWHPEADDELRFLQPVLGVADGPSN